MRWHVRPAFESEDSPAFRLCSEDGRMFGLTRAELTDLIDSARANLGKAIAEVKGVMNDWTTIKDKHPPRHQGRWHVYRPGYGFFYAQVCYGMHDPWWVPQHYDGRDNYGEGAPFAMKPDDLWRDVDPEPFASLGKAIAEVEGAPSREMLRTPYGVDLASIRLAVGAAVRGGAEAEGMIDAAITELVRQLEQKR